MDPTAMAATWSQAFNEQGPTNPRFSFEARDGVVVVKLAATERGKVVGESEAAIANPPAGVTPGRYKAFVHGTVMAARQIAARQAPEDLQPEELFCPELLSVPDLATADGFRRAIMDEGGTRTRIRARLTATELARQGNLPVPDEAGQVLLYHLMDPYSEASLGDQCDGLRKVVGERPDLAPLVALVAKGWAADPDAWWPTEPETEISGPRLLAGVLQTLLPGLPAAQRAPLAAAIAPMGALPSEQELSDLGLV